MKTEIFDTYNAVIRFQLYTGMRIGETLALTWNDIDFDERTININKTLIILIKNFSLDHQKQIIVIEFLE